MTKEEIIAEFRSLEVAQIRRLWSNPQIILSEIEENLELEQEERLELEALKLGITLEELIMIDEGSEDGKKTK